MSKALKVRLGMVKRLGENNFLEKTEEFFDQTQVLVLKKVFDVLGLNKEITAENKEKFLCDKKTIDKTRK